MSKNEYFAAIVTTLLELFYSMSARLLQLC